MPRPSLREALAVWALHGLFLALTLVTYSRVPAAELYNVSLEGIAGGLSRAVVYLNFPLAFVAIALLALAADRLGARWLPALGALLCAVAAVPGVLDVDDLDARPINAVPAIGVAIAAALTVAAWRRGGAGASNSVLLGDRARGGLAVALLVLGIPWWFAEAGFYAPDPILADEVPPGEDLAAVHLGRHHGTDGILLALSALALSRALAAFERRRLAAWASRYLALMLSYGLVIAAEDFWLEQVVKRGTTDRAIPSLLQPELEWGWLAILVVAAAVERWWFSVERRATPSPRPAPSPP